MKKILLLSQEFDYDTMITCDAGPQYALRMGWHCDRLGRADEYMDWVTVIDNRITAAECDRLEAYLIAHPDRLFLLKVVDPFREGCESHWYYRFLFRVKDLPHVSFLSVYQPTEIVADLDDATGNRKMAVIPYPFQDEYGITAPLKQRKKQLIVSGALHFRLYPERQQLQRQVRRNPLLWSKVHRLKHPGYPDTGQSQRHRVIGKAYVEYLSRFQFMFVSPSRCGLEFLKYGECAYAHCIPVGKPPETFGGRLRSTFLDLDLDHLARSLRRIFSIPLAELEEIADRYYEAMQAERNPALLNAHLDEFLINRYSFTGGF